MVEQSRFGMALLAIKQNEAAAEAAGINTLKWKLYAITLSGAIASAVGAFYAVVLLVVTPVSVFGMLVSAQALTVTLFGGVGTLWGPVIGAAILIPTAEILHAELGHVIPGIQGVIYGVAIVILILVAPEGMFWKVRDFVYRRWPHLVTTAPDTAASDGCCALQRDESCQASRRGDDRRRGSDPVGARTVQELRRPEGGAGRQLRRVARRDPRHHRPERRRQDHGLQPAQRLPAAGRGADPARWPRRHAAASRYQLCAAGVGRTFQIMRPFARMSVADNVVIGAYVRADTDAEARRLAADAIARVGLTAYAHRLAGELTTRELRLMELARALAGQPRILLLDETLAGLGHTEAEEVIGIIRRLAQDGITIVIIEHTMQAMVRLVDRFVVLDHGAVLVEGSPESVTRDPRVIEAYLGKKWTAYAQELKGSAPATATCP